MKPILPTALLALLLAASPALAERILVIPFNARNLPQSQQSLPKTLQQNLVSNLSRSDNVTAVPFQGNTIVEDNATAARLARNAQAPFALRGTAQFTGTDIHLTAQLLDAKTGELLRAASASGSVEDLPKLEADLADQIRTPAQPPVPPPTPAGTPTPVVILPPPVVYLPQYTPAYRPTYPYNYGYGYYPYFPALVPPGFSNPGVTITHTHQGPGSSNLPIPSGADMLPIPNINMAPTPTINMSPTPTRGVIPVPTTGR